MFWGERGQPSSALSIEWKGKEGREKGGGGEEIKSRASAPCGAYSRQIFQGREDATWNFDNSANANALSIFHVDVASFVGTTKEVGLETSQTMTGALDQKPGGRPASSLPSSTGTGISTLVAVSRTVQLEAALLPKNPDPGPLLSLVGKILSFNNMNRM